MADTPHVHRHEGAFAAMKILYVSPYAPERDGIADYCVALAATMRDRGHEVRVMSARPNRDSPADVISAVPATPTTVAAAVAPIARWDPDVIHVQFAVAAFASRTLTLLRVLRALRPLRAVIVVTMHEVSRDTASLRSVGRRLYRRMCRLCDVVVVHHQHGLEDLHGLAAGAAPECTVIPHPRAELPASTLTPDELRRRWGLGDARIVLAFGFIHVDKGLDDLARAMGRLARNAPSARLVVAGTVRPRHGAFKVFEHRDRRHLRQVKEILQGDGQLERTVFTDYVPGGEVAPWLRAATITVLPYRRIEDSGVANLALSASAPMIVSRSGNLPDYVANASWTFPPGDIDALTSCLRRVLIADPAAAAPADLTPSAGTSFDEVASMTAALYERHRPAPAPRGGSTRAA
jgi:glycosyltransferase involved in cell wall biosynthesis